MNISSEDREWDGLIDDVRIYNRALTAAEIQALATALRGDLDGNGTVELEDLRLMIYMLIGQQLVNLTTADLDGDGQLLLVDLQALVRILVGLP